MPCPTSACAQDGWHARHVTGLAPSREKTRSRRSVAIRTRSAPEFSAEASDGRVYSLRELLAESRVLLAFYPGNDTPG